MAIEAERSLAETPSESTWQVVGQIVAPHGLKGWVRVRCLSDFPERLLDPGPRWLRLAAIAPHSHDRTDPVATQLVRGQFYPPKKLYLVQFDLIQDRTMAEAWVGAEILVADTDRPTLGEEEYYLPDLIDLPVFHQPTGRKLGRLSAVIPSGNDLLQITTEHQETILIPFVKDLVPKVDLEAGRIEVIPPRGLLESFIKWTEDSPDAAGS